MKYQTESELISTENTKEFALKNYKTYVAHYKERDLEPVSFDEFLKNYCC
jgi:hypothetical protein